MPTQVIAMWAILGNLSLSLVRGMYPGRACCRLEVSLRSPALALAGPCGPSFFRPGGRPHCDAAGCILLLVLRASEVSHPPTPPPPPSARGSQGQLLDFCWRGNAKMILDTILE